MQQFMRIDALTIFNPTIVKAIPFLCGYSSLCSVVASLCAVVTSICGVVSSSCFEVSSLRLVMQPRTCCVFAVMR